MIALNLQVQNFSPQRNKKTITNFQFLLSSFTFLKNSYVQFNCIFIVKKQRKSIPDPPTKSNVRNVEDQTRQTTNSDSKTDFNQGICHIIIFNFSSSVGFSTFSTIYLNLRVFLAFNFQLYASHLETNFYVLPDNLFAFVVELL